MLIKNTALNFNLYTLIAVYLLILVGGIVRSMEAGMGCPDWPKCFGAYVPPTDDSILPAGYESYYQEARIRKNERLASVLTSFGFSQLSDRVLNDPMIASETKFDVAKAWVEYINRLIGVVIGLFIIGNMLLAFSYRMTSLTIPILGVVSFLLVLIQGWVGSLVVSTNLLPGFISFHMLLAMLLVMLLIYQRHLMQGGKKAHLNQQWIVPLLLVLFVTQIFLGISIREDVDVLKATSDLSRSLWVDTFNWNFYVHRSGSILLIALLGYFVYLNFQKALIGPVLVSLVGIVCLEILLGAIMSYFAIPRFAQPLHLLLALLSFGLLFYLFLGSQWNSSKAS